MTSMLPISAMAPRRPQAHSMPVGHHSASPDRSHTCPPQISLIPHLTIFGWLNLVPRGPRYTSSQFLVGKR